MWDPNCKKGFYWSTLRPIREGAAIHNPEYFAYLRTHDMGVNAQNAVNGINGINVPMANGANGACGVPHMRAILQKIKGLNMDLYRGDITKTYTRILELNEYYGPPRQNIDIMIRETQIAYLKKEISRDILKSRLQKYEKAAAKQQADREIEQMFAQMGTMLLNNLMLTTNSDEFLVIQDHLEQLGTLANDALAKVGARFNQLARTIY